MIKPLKIPPQVVPQAQHFHGSTVIQQLGLDTPQGLQRILQILTDKIDPESKGFYVTIEDINHSIETMVTKGRNTWIVIGEEDKILFQLCTPEDAVKIANARKP